LRRVRSAYRGVTQWGKSFLVTADALRSRGLIHAATSAPNPGTVRYQVARSTCEVLSKHWFVKRVTLFGSVAKGQDRAESDVDLAVEMLTNEAGPNHIVNADLQTIREKTGIEVNGLLLTPNLSSTNRQFFKHAGFFDAAQVLFHREGWSFRCGEKEFTYSLDSFLGATTLRTACEELSVIAFKRGKVRAHVVLIDERRSTPVGIALGIRLWPFGRFWITWAANEDHFSDGAKMLFLDGVCRLQERGVLKSKDPWFVYAERAQPRNELEQ